MIINILTTALTKKYNSVVFNETELKKVVTRNYLRCELEKVFYDLFQVPIVPKHQQPEIKKHEENSIESLRYFLPKDLEAKRKLFINCDNLIKHYAITGQF